MIARIIADELQHLAADVEQHGWHPETRSLIHLLSVDAWDALVTHLGEELVVPWERSPGRTQAEVAAVLRAAARATQTGGAS